MRRDETDKPTVKIISNTRTLYNEPKEISEWGGYTNEFKDNFSTSKKVTQYIKRFSTLQLRKDLKS